MTFSNEEKLRPYEAALREAGLEPVRVTAAPWPSLDGLLLTGGADINPARYGQPLHPKAQKPEDARDELEAALLGEALKADLPVLAICRGMQLFNVVHGGTLIQHLETGRHHEEHGMRILPETRLAAIAGAGEHSVNSRHHQAVDRVGANLIVSARAEDGIVEAIERTDRRFAVAVQWHPEDRTAVNGLDRKLSWRSRPAGGQIRMSLFSSGVVTHRSRKPNWPVSFTSRAASRKPVMAAR